MRKCELCGDQPGIHTVHLDDTTGGEIKVCTDCRDDGFVHCPRCNEWDKPENHGPYIICKWCVEEIVTAHERQAGYGQVTA
ncbi:hypothetical protein AAC03nite_20540 [Alicyclobacillus acidoterrestris]|nr:hypothetical protein AAC03nite_20540 [Alicyclobacillus acidoterrestris]